VPNLELGINLVYRPLGGKGEGVTRAALVSSDSFLGKAASSSFQLELRHATSQVGRRLALRFPSASHPKDERSHEARSFAKEETTIINDAWWFPLDRLSVSSSLNRFVSD